MVKDKSETKNQIESEEELVEIRFTKEQWLTSDRFVLKADLVSALLSDGVEYTATEIDKEIKAYLERSVE